MKASFLISELLEVEKSLAVRMFWLSTTFQENYPSPIFSVMVVYGKFGFIINHKKSVFQTWDYVYLPTDIL